jgi:D-alanyl-lipoteichoic acid acyltransferase DltB (MBOAT superfamily)
MLFCSYIFIFAFLPITFAGYYLLGRWATRRVAMAWLVVASLVFYGFFNWTLLFIIGSSMVANYAVLWILERDSGGIPSTFRKSAMIFGVVFNLALLGYYKYAMFIVNNVTALTGSEFVLKGIILPLGISFYTFQQIGCVVDIYRQPRGKLYPVVEYMLFVTFFPQLVAGPIVSHAEMMPQFEKPEVARLNGVNLAPGLHLFAIGLFKKLVIADLFAPWATAGWNLSSPSFSQTLFTLFAFMFQLYFDFSGYSDMAIGLGRMFNIRLPLNFNSPLRATSITDLWRRWHITLGTFLTQYIYIPLGGNRKGPFRAYVNLSIVFLLCGIWHGASWLFVIWGAINAVAMVAHRFWQKRGWKMPAVLGWLLTFGIWIPSLICTRFNGTWEQAVNLTRGLFSKPDFPHALKLIRVVAYPESQPLWWMLAATIIVFCFPNAATRLDKFRATLPGAWFTAILLVVAIFHISLESPFIYFNF